MAAAILWCMSDCMEYKGLHRKREIVQATRDCTGNERPCFCCLRRGPLLFPQENRSPYRAPKPLVGVILRGPVGADAAKQTFVCLALLPSDLTPMHTDTDQSQAASRPDTAMAVRIRAMLLGVFHPSVKGLTSPARARSAMPPLAPFLALAPTALSLSPGGYRTEGRSKEKPLKFSSCPWAGSPASARQECL